MLICFQFLNKSARFYSHVHSRLLCTGFFLCLSLCCATCYTLRRFQSKCLHSQFGPYLIWQHSFRFVFFFGVSRFLHFASFCFYVDSIYLCHSMHGNTKKFLKIDCGFFFRLYIFVVYEADQ